METPSPLDPDAQKAQRLKKTKRWAASVLVVLVLIYLATFLHPDPPGWLRLIRHMAEAGMIGGLADWFAVVALFRHPLGIKIPHTALLPRNKARAAESVGQFFKTYFLKPSSISTRVAELALARRAAEWLQHPDHAKLVAEPLTQAIAIAMGNERGLSLNDGLRQEIKTALASKPVTTGLTNALAPVLTDAIKGPLMDDALVQISKALDNNRERVLDVVRDKSRWWIPERVDRGVATTLVDGTISVLGDLEDPKSEVRKDFTDGLTSFVDNLIESGAIERAIHQGKTKFTRSAAFKDILETSLNQIRTSLSEGITKDPTKIEAAVAQALQRFATKLLADEAALERFEAQLASTAETTVIELQDPIAKYVQSVIDNWEADELVTRFEREIGPDLQFIRINGAVLGALIGGCLFFFEKGLTLLGAN
ncbi:MAG: DUF445 domain-containing protein [Pseudomonadota bacterium]